MFICIGPEEEQCGLGKTLQEAWETAKDNGIEDWQFEDCTFYELAQAIEVEQTIVPKTTVVKSTTTRKQP